MSGTRGGIGRLAAMAVGLVVVLALGLAEAAWAGNYEVAQCGWGIGAELDPSLPRVEGDGGFLHPGYCTAPPPGVAPGMNFETGPAPEGDRVLVRARWAAPPGTWFVGARFSWGGELQRFFWQTASADDGVELHGYAGALLSNAPHPVETSFAGPGYAFEVQLECLLLAPEMGCQRTGRSSLWLGGLILTVADPVPPTARLGGALVAPGWHRGSVPLEIGGDDPVGSGVAWLETSIDGGPGFPRPVACAVALIEGQWRGTRLRPCPPSATQDFESDTAQLADGAHTLRACAVDLGGGTGCAPTVQILVDNSAPTVEFTAAPEGQVAARVSDPYSGPAAGTIAVRRADSESWSDVPTTFEPGGGGVATLRAQLPDLSAGAYFFRATASDAVGNSASAQFRASGSAEELRRQAAAGGGETGAKGGGSAARGADGKRSAGRHGRGHGRAAHLTAHLGSAGSRLTVDYGATAEVRGRLTDSHGGGIVGRRVAVVTHTAGGFGGAPERRRVATGPGGRFALRLPPGTSRRVTVVFHGGGGFAAAPGRPLSLRVRAAVSLAAAPPSLSTGEEVHFVGAVRRGPARIPGRGKLVAIQYLDRASDHWRPALVIRTGTDGHFHADYRFRYITGAARIRFRATALPEAGWPYAPGSSDPVTVAVHGR
jgi:hypothetical protein